MAQLPQKSTQSYIELNPNSIEINFNEYGHLNFKSKNISSSHLSGKVTSKHLFNRINIINCNLQNIDSSKVNLYNSDIKDCAINNCIFNDTDFTEAAHINNYVNNTKYYKCNFNQTAITNSEFRNTEFIDCDLTDIIISSSRFINCGFLRCKTSNKIIESSLLFDCKFEETTILLETITENFGLTIHAMINSMISIKRARGDVKCLKLSDFKSKHILKNQTPIESFLLHYFSNPAILAEGSDDVDKTFDFGTWLDLSKNPNRFRTLIERYHEFIMHEYDNGRAPFWMILKFHKMTSELTESIQPSKLEVYRSILGVHMSLARMVELYLELTA